MCYRFHCYANRPVDSFAVRNSFNVKKYEGFCGSQSQMFSNVNNNNIFWSHPYRFSWAQYVKHNKG